MYTGPHIVEDGLVFAIDAGSTRSYSGSGTTVTDLVGTNNGTLTNGVGYNSANGGSFTFDGTDDIIITPGTAATNISTTLTAEAWVYYESGNGRIFQKDGATYTRCWEMGSYAGYFRVELWHSNGIGIPAASSPSALAVNGWTYVALTFDGTDVKMYQNGALVKTVNFPGNIRTDINTPLTIGGRWSSGEYFDGNIAPTRLYNQALTAAEILQNYNAQKSRFL